MTETRSASGKASIEATVRDLHPSYFAVVMATGIVSIAAGQAGQAPLSDALLVVASVSYAVLCAMYAWRLLRHRADFLLDARSSHRAFGFFTFVAGSNVLGERFLLAGDAQVTLALALLGLAGYVVLTYAVPAWSMLATSKQPLGQSVNGTWLLWVVATQSVSTVAATLAHAGSHVAGLSVLAVCFWALGVVLYGILIVLVMMRLLLIDLAADHLSPPYWISMGATAISVLAGSHILRLPASLPIVAAARATVEGTSLLLWAFGTWWIPLLVLFGVHRHLVKWRPLGYEPLLWSVVFPLGMYAASSREFGAVEHLGFMVAIAKVGVWVAVGAWVLVFGSMLGRWAAALRPALPGVR
ncbi:MAG: tellurite resistance/C4-dicarboxylate transporter family protein [Candidatus Dormibacteraceae bacterium]